MGVARGSRARRVRWFLQASARSVCPRGPVFESWLCGLSSSPDHQGGGYPVLQSIPHFRVPNLARSEPAAKAASGSIGIVYR